MELDELTDWAEASLGDGCLADYKECLQRREKVDQFISECAARYDSYMQVKEGVEHLNKSLDFREEQYVGLKYVHYCTKQFLDSLNAELPGYLKQLGSNREQIMNFSKKCLEDTQSIQDVAKNFSFLNSSVLMSNCVDANLLGKRNAGVLLTRLQSIVWEHLCEAYPFMQIEKHFITELDSCCMKCFKKEIKDERLYDLIHNKQETDNSVAQLFELLVDTCDINLDRLRSLASKLGKAADQRDDFKEIITKNRLSN